MALVISFGTFDNFHPGHADYLKQAARHGDKLLVVVARDSNVLKLKGRPPQAGEKDRLRAVKDGLRTSGLQVRVILGDRTGRFSILGRYRPDVIALGYDQPVNFPLLEKYLADHHLSCKIRIMKAYEPQRYKSSFCLSSLS